MKKGGTTKKKKKQIKSDIKWLELPVSTVSSAAGKKTEIQVFLGKGQRLCEVWTPVRGGGGF